MAQRTCSEDGCEEEHLARGFCGKHYRERRAAGLLALKPKELRVCSLDDCGERYQAEGYCAKHYNRFVKYGDPYGGRQSRDGLCVIEDCGEPKYGRGWCCHHYRTWETHGDPLYMRPTAAERFWSKVNKDGPLPERRPELGPCWVWTANAHKKSGYGKFGVKGKTILAHRWSYTEEVGPIPEGLQLDHLCRNTACVRPDHLEPVPGKVNLLRGDTIVAANAAKTKCPAGHDYDLINTRYAPDGRYCYLCRRDGQIARRKRPRDEGATA